MIAKQYKDISGQRFGRLVAKEYIGKNKHRFALWSCACDCGEMMVTTGYSLRKGGTRSCGCLKSEIDSVKAQQMIHIQCVFALSSRFRELLLLFWQNLLLNTRSSL